MFVHILISQKKKHFVTSTDCQTYNLIMYVLNSWVPNRFIKGYILKVIRFLLNIVWGIAGGKKE